MAASSDDYLLLAARQRIRWQPMEGSTFAEAKRTGKPLLLAMGTAWSQAAREFDDQVFSNLEVAERVNRDFFPVRIDLVSEPAWRDIFLSLARAAIGASSDFQVYAISPDGKVLSWLNQPQRNKRFDEVEFLSSLRNARHAFEQGLQTPSVLEQVSEVQRLESVSTVAAPNIGPFLAALAENLDVEFGGFFPNDPVRVWHIQDWNLLQAVGQHELLTASVQPRLRSRMINWLDGGIFSSQTNGREQYVNFSVVTQQSSRAMAFFAAYGEKFDSRLATMVARRTFDFIDRLFEAGLPTYAFGKTEPNGRSTRYSIPRRRLTEVLEPDDQLWGQNTFGLTVGWNPQLIPYARESAPLLAEPERANRILNELRADSPADSLETGTQLTMDVAGQAVADLIATALVLGDDQRLSKALARFDLLTTLRVGGSDLIHCQVADGLPKRYLSDYLAYVSACLATYIATGKVEFLDEGRVVLRRASQMFLRNGRLVNADLSEYGMSRASFEVPSITDGTTPSTTATAISLLHTFGSLENGPSDFGRLAESLTTGMSEVANAMPRAVAGFYLSSLRVQSNRIMFTVGPDAVSIARRLAYRDPSMDVIPLIGNRRKDVQAQGPGIFLVRGSLILGPLTMSEAEGLLNSSATQ